MRSCSPRKELGLTGSKLGCGEGGCGACTVLVSQCIDRHTGEIEHRTVNACLTLLCSMDGCHVVTVEGIGSTSRSNLHSVQSRLATLSGSQCGFCTPGMVMSLYGSVTSNSEVPLTMQDIEESLDGNLCRCTGYRPILDAAKTFASDIDTLPKKKSSQLTSTTLDKCLSFTNEQTHPVAHVEFPPKLKAHTPRSLHIKGDSLPLTTVTEGFGHLHLGCSIEWYRPITLPELLHLRQRYPGDAGKLVFGNTRVHIETSFQQRNYPCLISLTHIKELQQTTRTDDSLVLGAGVTFSRLKAKLTEWIKDPKDDSAFCQALLQQLKRFASTQIRNVASLGGNIVAASPM